LLSGRQPSNHRITGIAPGFIAEALGRDMIDEVVTVREELAYEMPRKLAQMEGVLCGMSGGVALHAALTVAARKEFKGKNVVAILADSGERYTSTSLFTSEKSDAFVISELGDSPVYR